MPKKIKNILILGGIVLLIPMMVWAQGAGLLEYTTYTVFGLAQVSDLCQLIEGIWNLLFAFLIVAAFISIVVAGYLYSTAGVNPSNVNTAKNMLAGAVVGLLLGATSYMILNTIQPTLVTATCEIAPVDVGVTVIGPGGIGDSLGGIGDEWNGTTGGGTTVPANEISAAIYNSALAYRGTSTAAGPDGGNLACAWAVNNVLANAGVEKLGLNGNYDYVPFLESDLKQGRGVEIDPSQAQPGDIVIASNGHHVGIYMGNGVVLSNSSSRAAFVWESDINFDGYYGGGSSRVYRVTS